MLVNYAFFDYRLDAEKYRDLVYQNNHEKINCFVISATNYIEHDMKLWYVETPNSKFAVCWVFTKAIEIRRPFFEFYDVESSAAMALKLIKDEDKLKLDKVACVVSIEEYKMYNPPMHSLWQLCKEDKILYRYPTKYSFDYGQMLVYISFIEQGSSK